MPEATREPPETAAAPTRPATLVTGASSGIGRELARLAARTDEVMLTGRDEAALRALAHELGGKAHWHACDLGRPGAPAELMAAMSARGLHCHRLVNNAGFGLVGQAHELSAEEQLASLDVNVRALTELTLAALPGMMGRREGGVLNLGSVAAFLPGPGIAVYYAGKAYVQALSESLWAEAAERGVTITTLAPGPVNTAFLARATKGARSTESTIFHLDAAEVARQGWEGFLAGRMTVIPGLGNRIVVALSRIAPRRLLAKAVQRRQMARVARS